MDCELQQVSRRFLLAFACFSRFLLRRGNIFIVNIEPSLIRHQPRQIDGEAVRVVQPPYILASQFLRTICLALLCEFLEHVLTAIKRLGEAQFLLVQNFLHVDFLVLDLWEHVAHLIDECGHNLGEEVANLSVEVLASIARTAPEYATHNVASADVVGHASVRYRECKKSYVICNDSVCSIHTVCVVVSELASVLACTSDLLDCVEEWREHVSIII